FNQLDAYNAPEGKLYWDATNNRPAANNPWLNPFAPHPYSVFDDLNHTTAATQYWVSRALEFWLKEYKIDGYRFDLAKGFTQTPSNDVTVENYDQSRVDNLLRYYDSIIPKFPGTYMILEFLGNFRSEEQEYVRRGFMVWGKNTDAYNQSTMGYASNSDFSKVVYKSGQEQLSIPAEVGYMESHDEERLMYKNLQYGNSANGYDVKNLPTALEREAAAAALFFTVPGPKMLWQFGERGYDLSINSNGGRTNAKPPHWEYMADPNRLKLFDAYSKLINLRISNPAVFNNNAFTYDFYDNGGLFKRFQIGDPVAGGMQVTVIANFDVIAQTRIVTFQTTGDWFNYLSNGNGGGISGATGNTFNLAAADQTITLQPGEYHVYLYQPFNVYTFIGNGNWSNATNWMYNSIPPTPLPAGAEILINAQSGGACILDTPLILGPGNKFTIVAGKVLRLP
ncbi:MAG: alpha-amylase family glycosyl hydrolase, partial [Ferruginibacter sp.]